METYFESINNKERSLPEQAADQIAKLIMENHLTSENKLPSEFELAELLNVGRGTVREAVKLLVARNVLEIRRGKGTYLAPNPGEVPDPLGFAYYPDQMRLALDLVEIRSQLEPWVARMAAEHATAGNIELLRECCAKVEQDILNKRDHSQNDVQFHVAIAECTQNLVVPRLIPIITYSITLFVSLTESRLRTETIIGHRELLEAISDGDGLRAEKSMIQHIEYNKALLQEITRREGVQ
ncbi:MAG: FadR family transcriptional regulator [Lachnospiraceae bacterium]|nr:FadR family transcriptional regulator [Lachnospiraceae bacterium]